jgi:DNA-directed RNA polymerase specialized sigma subunit
MNTSAQKPRQGHLAEPLTEYESDWVGFLYAKNIGLVRAFIKKLKARYPAASLPDIKSCVDIGFIKAAIIWRSDKGKFSTIFYQHARGEVTHFIRSNASWDFSAPRRDRELALRIKNLVTMQNVAIKDLPAILDCSEEKIREVIGSTLRAERVLRPGEETVYADDWDEDEDSDLFEGESSVSTWHGAS